MLLRVLQWSLLLSSCGLCNRLRSAEEPGATRFEVKAIVTECPLRQCSNSSGEPPRLSHCRKKLTLTVNMISEGAPNDKSQYIIVDHIVDAVTARKVRILNPYAVRIRQRPLMQLFGLHFERAVNAEAREEVSNRDSPGFGGCDGGGGCRPVRAAAGEVPYSAGFCCSCEPGDDEDAVREERGDDGSKIRQRRGGQTCDDVDLEAVPQSFFESAHCLTFSNLWYSVYGLDEPRIVHNLSIQIFQKYEDNRGNTHWMDLTGGKVVQIGNNRREIIDKDIIAKYTPEKCDFSDQALDYKNIKLLVPEKKITNPEHFMILSKKLISEDGNKCDTAGVGYEAFYKQEKRCARPQGSCLNNQPQHFFRNDLKAEKEGRPGSHFLKFYGTLAEDPIEYNSSGQLQYLKMVYTKKHTTKLYFELNADLVTLLKPNSLATITEIYTDATNPEKTRIVVKVTNSALLYGIYYVRLTNCPMTIPASFNNIASKSVLILPQHQHIFNLYIEYPLPVEEFYCSIHVHNINQELLAIRAVRIQTYDRCICIWQCECACYVTDRGLKCTPMSLDAYHQAGFQGGFPFPTKLVETSYLDEMLALLLHMFTFLIITLLAMGFIKALLGLCCKEIGLWGLDVILGTDKKPKHVCDNEDCEWRQAAVDTGISPAAKFCLNLIFFILYPLVLCNIAIGKFCFSTYTDEGNYCYQQKSMQYMYEAGGGYGQEECVEECDGECRRRRNSMAANEDSVCNCCAARINKT